MRLLFGTALEIWLVFRGVGEPALVAQSDARPTGELAVAGPIPPGPPIFFRGD